MSKTRLLLLALSVSFAACGDDPPSKRGNTVVVNSANSANSTDGNASNSADIPTSTSNSTNTNASNNGSGPTTITDGTLLSEITEDDVVAICEDVESYYQAVGAMEVLCQVEGYFAAAEGEDDATMQEFCFEAQERCLTEGPQDAFCSVPLGCDATVGDARACLEAQGEQAADYASELLPCDEITADSLAQIEEILGAIEQPSACLELRDQCF